jgi:hypothetical protein
MEPFTPFVSLGFFLLFGRLPASLAVTQPYEGIRAFTLPRGHSGFTLPLKAFSLAFRLLNLMRGFGFSSFLGVSGLHPPFQALLLRLLRWPFGCMRGFGFSP